MTNTVKVNLLRDGIPTETLIGHAGGLTDDSLLTYRDSSARLLARAVVEGEDDYTLDLRKRSFKAYEDEVNRRFPR